MKRDESTNRVAKEKSLHVRMGDGAAILHMHDHVRLPVPIGNYYGFDWHDYLGPTFCGKTGEPRAQQPSERHPVWDIFEKWMRAGKLVDARGYAVLTPPSGGTQERGEG